MMADHRRFSLVTSVRVILALHVILLYYMLIQNVYRAGKGVDDKLETTTQDLESVPKETIKLSLGSSGLRFMNAIVTDYREDYKLKLKELLSRKADPCDPHLVSLVRQLMDPPSGHIVKPVKTIVQTPQSVEILKCLKERREGFFVEVGALDGERSSNTLYLEQHLGWTGLLIEADPYFYTQLMGKSRRSWSINACISVYQHPTIIEFQEASGGNGQLLLNNGKTKNTKKRTVSRQVPCFSLETMLLALNQTHVDYFSLDVEGFELDVLKTIPFDKIDIATLSVEYVHGKHDKEAHKSFMLEKGYRVHKDIHLHKPDIALFVDDFIFVKSDL